MPPGTYVFNVQSQKSAFRTETTDDFLMLNYRNNPTFSSRFAFWKNMAIRAQPIEIRYDARACLRKQSKK